MPQTIMMAATSEPQPDSSSNDLANALRHYQQALADHPEFELGVNLTTLANQIVPALAAAWPLHAADDDCLLTIWHGIAAHISSRHDELVQLSVAMRGDVFLQTENLLWFDMEDGLCWHVTDPADFASRAGLWVQYQIISAESDADDIVRREQLEATLAQNTTRLSQWQHSFRAIIMQAQFDAATSMEAQTALRGLLNKSSQLAVVLSQQAQLGKQARKSVPAELAHIVRQTQQALAAQVINPKLPEQVRSQLRQALQSLDKIITPAGSTKAISVKQDVSHAAFKTISVKHETKIPSAAVIVPQNVPQVLRSATTDKTASIKPVSTTTKVATIKTSTVPTTKLAARPATILKADNDTNRLILVNAATKKPIVELSNKATIPTTNKPANPISAKSSSIPATKVRSRPAATLKADNDTRHLMLIKPTTSQPAVQVRKTPTAPVVRPTQTVVKAALQSIKSKPVIQPQQPTALHKADTKPAAPRASIAKPSTIEKVMPISVRTDAMNPATTRQGLTTPSNKLADISPPAVVAKTETSPKSLKPAPSITAKPAIATAKPAAQLQSQQLTAPVTETTVAIKAIQSAATKPRQASTLNNIAHSNIVQPIATPRTQAEQSRPAGQSSALYTPSVNTAQLTTQTVVPPRTADQSSIPTIKFNNETASIAAASPILSGEVSKHNNSAAASANSTTLPEAAQQAQKQNTQSQTSEPPKEQAVKASEVKLASAVSSAPTNIQAPAEPVHQSAEQSFVNTRIDAPTQKQPDITLPAQQQEPASFATQIYNTATETVQSMFKSAMEGLCTGGKGCIYCVAKSFSDINQSWVDTVGQISFVKTAMAFVGQKLSHEIKLDSAKSGKAASNDIASRRKTPNPA